MPIYPSQTVLPTGDQLFKHKSHWRLLSFKQPQRCCLKKKCVFYERNILLKDIKEKLNERRDHRAKSNVNMSVLSKIYRVNATYTKPFYEI